MSELPLGFEPGSNTMAVPGMAPLAYGTMMQMLGKPYSISPGMQRPMSADEARANQLRESSERVRARGLPRYHEYTSGDRAYQYNMPQGENVALRKKLRRADAAIEGSGRAGAAVGGGDLGTRGRDKEEFDHDLLDRISDRRRRRPDGTLPGDDLRAPNGSDHQPPDGAPRLTHLPDYQPPPMGSYAPGGSYTPPPEGTYAPPASAAFRRLNQMKQDAIQGTIPRKSSGTPKTRANPRTSQLERWREIAAADASQPDFGAMRIPPEPRSKRVPANVSLKGRSLILAQRGAPPPAAKPMVGPNAAFDRQQRMKALSPAERDFERTRERVAERLGMDPTDVDDQMIADTMRGRRSAALQKQADAKDTRFASAEDRAAAVRQSAKDREAVKNRGGWSDDPFKNLATAGVMLNNPDMVASAVSGMNARSAEEGANTRHQGTLDFENQRQANLHQEAVDRLEHDKKVASDNYNLAKQNGDRTLMSFWMAHFQNAQQNQHQHEKELEQLKNQGQILQNQGRGEKQLTRDEMRSGDFRAWSDAHPNFTPADHRAFNDEFDRSHPEPNAAAQPMPQQRVREDMKAGNMTDEVYELMKSRHPKNVVRGWSNGFLGIDSLSPDSAHIVGLIKHFRNAFPDIPSKVLPRLVAEYYAKKQAED